MSTLIVVRDIAAAILFGVFGELSHIVPARIMFGEIVGTRLVDGELVITHDGRTVRITEDTAGGIYVDGTDSQSDARLSRSWHVAVNSHIGATEVQIVTAVKDWMHV